MHGTMKESKKKTTNQQNHKSRKNLEKKWRTWIILLQDYKGEGRKRDVLV